MDQRRAETRAKPYFAIVALIRRRRSAPRDFESIETLIFTLPRRVLPCGGPMELHLRNGTRAGPRSDEGALRGRRAV